MSPEKDILFVCTGNVCRSPMAEHIFRHRVGPHSGWRAGSAGVFAMNGARASEPAVLALREWGVDLTSHQSRALTPGLVDGASLVVVMTRSHYQKVVEYFPSAAGKVFMLTQFSTSGEQIDIPDPIGATLEIYRNIRDRLDGCISDLILSMAEQGSIQLETSEKTKTMKISVGADHGGVAIKEKVKAHLEDRGIEVIDVGAEGEDSVDYPDFAFEVTRHVSRGASDTGILICKSGLGMSIAANKHPRIRAALCSSPEMARLAREHNDANVLALGSLNTSPEQAVQIVDAWINARFEGGRHQRRVGKILREEIHSHDPIAVQEADPEVYESLIKEVRRQHENIELIASENYTSAAVRAAQGSLMTNKYAEGYPKKRWYHGCENVDVAEQLAIDRAKELFGAEHANVQPHSGSAANMAVYFSVLEPGDTLLAMSLAEGGHLTHGHPMNFSGRFFHVVPYGVDKETEHIDYDRLDQLARESKPKLICAGASAYSRIIDFPRLRGIADEVGALLMVDMAHFAGLVAGGVHPNPAPHCDFVTSTTHKTLRGPRGGLVLCREPYAADVNKQVFPGIQGGPLMHVIAAKAVCFKEALQPSFKEYAKQVVRNAQALAAALQEKGIRIVSGGTDNHLFLVDLFNTIGVTGKEAAGELDKVHITVNKNVIPFDTKSPFVTSGIRLGTPAVTTRGMLEEDMVVIADCMVEVLKNLGDEKVAGKVRERVLALTARFPVP